MVNDPLQEAGASSVSETGAHAIEVMDVLVDGLGDEGRLAGKLEDAVISVKAKVAVYPHERRKKASFALIASFRAGAFFFYFLGERDGLLVHASPSRPRCGGKAPGGLSGRNRCFCNVHKATGPRRRNGAARRCSRCRSRCRCGFLPRLSSNNCP